MIIDEQFRLLIKNLIFKIDGMRTEQNDHFATSPKISGAKISDQVPSENARQRRDKGKNFGKKFAEKFYEK